MQRHYNSKEEMIESLVNCVSTTVSGFDRDWCRRQLNVHFGDRVMIETEGQELGDWLELTPPRPEPGVPSEPDEEYEDVELRKLS